jgi:hypothetical protein
MTLRWCRGSSDVWRGSGEASLLSQDFQTAATGTFRSAKFTQRFTITGLATQSREWRRSAGMSKRILDCGDA